MVAQQKADWIALDTNKNERFRVRTLGLNPAVISSEELTNRIVNMFQLISIKDEVSQIYFYGAGCGTPKACTILKDVMQAIFKNADISVAEDMLAAVYAASGKNPALVCILGTGSNSCYYDGQNMQMQVPSLGYVLMDEASGNYFGKRLIRDYFYGMMPKLYDRAILKLIMFLMQIPLRLIFTEHQIPICIWLLLQSLCLISKMKNMSED